MLPETNHPFGSVEELLVQMGPSTPPLSPEEVEKHWTSKGRKEATVDGSKADKGEGDEMGKLLRELGVIVDKDASAAPITGGGLRAALRTRMLPVEREERLQFQGKGALGNSSAWSKTCFAHLSLKRKVCACVCVGE